MLIALCLLAGFAALAGLSSAAAVLLLGLGMTGLVAALGFGVLALGAALWAAILAFAPSRDLARDLAVGATATGS